ncbi:MAG: hypothetical protein MZV70_44070 [Desulfobacterales bacterium]|nr:hypothetical protein [Desulfobacterales bacterium]
MVPPNTSTEIPVAPPLVPGQLAAQPQWLATPPMDALRVLLRVLAASLHR